VGIFLRRNQRNLSSFLGRSLGAQGAECLVSARTIATVCNSVAEASVARDQSVLTTTHDDFINIRLGLSVGAPSVDLRRRMLVHSIRTIHLLMFVGRLTPEQFPQIWPPAPKGVSQGVDLAKFPAMGVIRAIERRLDNDDGYVDGLDDEQLLDVLTAVMIGIGRVTNRYRIDWVQATRL
jgi:hypothetical protein